MAEGEPMIDQEMFLQMMESMDKDGDGTVTKARNTSHTLRQRCCTHASLSLGVACKRGPAPRQWCVRSPEWQVAHDSAVRPASLCTSRRHLAGPWLVGLHECTLGWQGAWPEPAS